MKPVMVSSSFCLLSCSISAPSKYTQPWDESTQQKTSQPFPQWSLTLFDSGSRKGTFSYLCSPGISRTQGCSISTAQGCGLIWMEGADKVRVKFPSEKNRLYKEASASNKLTFTFSYCKILIKKMRSTPIRAPRILSVSVYKPSWFTVKIQ